MGKKTKIVISIIIVLVALSFVWFDFFFLEKNASLFKQELMSAGETDNVIIVFNPGGWGVVSLDKAIDFNQTVFNIKSLVENMGYKVSIVPYYRTRDDLWGKIGSIKELILNFPSSSRVFSNKIEEFLKENPDDKIIMAGLSNGAVFVDSTMIKLKNYKNRVTAIEVGSPFWSKNMKEDNILLLNKDQDILSKGNIIPLLEKLISTPFYWTWSNLTGRQISFTEALHVSGHDYLWTEIEPSVSDFIVQRF